MIKLSFNSQFSPLTSLYRLLHSHGNGDGGAHHRVVAHAEEAYLLETRISITE